MPANNSGVQRYVGLYVYNRALNDTQVNNDLANIVNTIIRADDGKNNYVAGDSADLALDYNYVVSVSADTITLDANHGKSVTVVAVNVARNLGE